MDMKILRESVEYNEDYMDIDSLKFLKDNPRVYAVTHGELDFEQKPGEEQQDIIFDKLKHEPSVKNLVPEIERHGGLIEPILVRLDTREVIEGNSRLAVYRVLRERGARGEWDRIPCYLISTLTDEQQAAFLNQIHVKGKTQWSAYEKANFAYVRRINGWTVDRIAKLFGESVPTIYKRINAIKTMNDSGDNERSHFSYYDVVVRKPEIYGKIGESPEFRDRLFEEIRNVGTGEDQKFTAQDLRNGLPAIIKKPRILNRYVNGDVEFDEAWDRAKVSPAEDRVKRALSLLEEISKTDVSGLRQNSLNSLAQAVKKLDRVVGRIRGMIDMGGGK